MAAADLIDLTKINVQQFSFQKPLINYIFYNSGLILSQKLIKCCKFFKLFHFKLNQSRLNELSVNSEKCSFDGGLSNGSIRNLKRNIYCECRRYNINDNVGRFRIDTKMKSIKILYSLTLSCDIHVRTLLPKLDLSGTKEICIITFIVLKSDILEKILQPSLSKFYLHCHPCEKVNPALLVLQRCPKIKEIDITVFNKPPVPVLSQNILKEMLLTKRESKIEKLIFEPVAEIDQDDFMKFLNNHFGSISFISFTVHEIGIFNDFIQTILRMKEIRQNESKMTGIKIHIWFEDCFEEML